MRIPVALPSIATENSLLKMEAEHVSNLASPFLSSCSVKYCVVVYRHEAELYTLLVLHYNLFDIIVTRFKWWYVWRTVKGFVIHWVRRRCPRLKHSWYYVNLYFILTCYWFVYNSVVKVLCTFSFYALMRFRNCSGDHTRSKWTNMKMLFEIRVYCTQANKDRPILMSHLFYKQ